MFRIQFVQLQWKIPNIPIIQFRFAHKKAPKRTQISVASILAQHLLPSRLERATPFWPYNISQFVPSSFILHNLHHKPLHSLRISNIRNLSLRFPYRPVCIFNTTSIAFGSTISSSLPFSHLIPPFSSILSFHYSLLSIPIYRYHFSQTLYARVPSQHQKFHLYLENPSSFVQLLGAPSLPPVKILG